MNNERENYQEPEIEIIHFEDDADIITTSGIDANATGLGRKITL